MVVALAAGAARAQPPGPAIPAGDGFVLLRNGQVFQGRISRAGNYYQVDLPDGLVRVRAADVEFLCRDLEEGYQRKRAAIGPGNLHGHLELAQWCQRHGLLGCAANELSAAMDLDPNHPLIEVLQRRLKAALAPPEPLRPARPVVAQPSGAELDRMVRGMPPGTVEMFTQTVQPLLTNHCTSSGCHSMQTESKFKLMRGPATMPPSRRLTQRNLHSVLQCIDRANPEASPLLTAPSGPHGSAKAAIFTDRQLGQYRRVVDWVYRVAQQTPPADLPGGGRAADSVAAADDPWQAPAALPRTTQARPISRSPRGPVDRHVRPASAAEPVDPQDGQSGAAQKPGAKRSPGPKPPPPAPAAPSPADDPFDPEVFNRRFLPQTAPATTPAE